MCCRHSLAGSKQGKSRGCSRSGSKQQRRQERHFLVPTVRHIAASHRRFIKKGAVSPCEAMHDKEITNHR